MPIVLAIEPDRRQAAHLTAIVRHQVGAELLLADTTEGALDAIGDRIPDLVLVPALLSPQDDAALAAALRVIAAAAHVRTLTIPVLSSGTKRAAVGGMLAKWRKTRAASPEPDGCDPAVFGEQISTYLREAAAERAQLEDDLIGNERAGIAPPMTVHAEAIAAERMWGEPNESRAPIESMERVNAIEPIEAIEQLDAIEPVQAIAHVDAFEELERIEADEAIEPVVEAVELWAAQPADEPIDESIDEPSNELDDPAIDLSGQLEAMSDEADGELFDGELFDGEEVGVYTISADADEPRGDTLDLLPSILEPEANAEPIEAPVAAVLFAESFFAETAAAPMFAQSDFVEPPEPPRPDIQPWVPMYLIPGRMWPALEGMPAETPAPRTEPDWIELVASLRQDLERRRADPAAVADPIVVRPSDGAKADVLQLVKKPRVHARKAKPVQDEWGFFDPEQCGFSTLLAKLEEITEDSRP